MTFHLMCVHNILVRFWLLNFDYFGFTNGCVSLYINAKRDDFDSDKVNFPFLDGTFPIVTLMGFTFHNLLGLLECAVM